MSGSWNTKSELPSSMNSTKHRSKGRGGGGRGQRNYRAGSSPPPQHVNAFSNIEDAGSNINIYENKYFVYYITSNLGETARIVVRSGDIYEGILRAVSPKFDCTLNEAHLLHQRQPNGHIEDELAMPCTENLISKLVIALKDMVSVSITKTHDPDVRAANDNFTDEAISGSHRRANGQRNERQLQKWVPEDSDPTVHAGLEENLKVNGWNAVDMFDTNAKKFGVTSTYNDNLLQYTTPLPKDSTREMELRAEQTAREIEQSRGHSLREEVDRGRTEEESFASVVRPSTAATTASKPPQASNENLASGGKPQRGAQAKPTAMPLQVERKSVTLNTDAPPTTALSSAAVDAGVVSSPATTVTSDSVTTATKTTVAEVVSSTPDSVPATTAAASSATSQSGQHEIVKGLIDFHSNFQLAEKQPRKSREPANEGGKISVAAAQPDKTPTEELPSSETPPEDSKGESKKSSSSSSDSILNTSKLNPLAKEFKFTPKPQASIQKTTPPPQPQYVVAAPPFSPTSVRPGHPSGAFPQPMVMMPPQQLNMYRPSKQPFHKPRAYAGREQGESPPSFISAAAATGSPIIAPGGSFPQQMYMPPPHQAVYVQSPAGMVPQQIPVGQYVLPPGHGPRFIAPVTNPPGGPPASMSQAYQDAASPMSLYVAGNMGTVQGNPNPQGQPQPSPSQPGQFIFATVPQMGGHPQPGGPHQGPQYAQSQMFYIQQPPQQVGPSSSVPVSAATGPVPYMTGNYHGERLQ